MVTKKKNYAFVVHGARKEPSGHRKKQSNQNAVLALINGHSPTLLPQQAAKGPPLCTLHVPFCQSGCHAGSPATHNNHPFHPAPRWRLLPYTTTSTSVFGPIPPHIHTYDNTLCHTTPTPTPQRSLRSQQRASSSHQKQCHAKQSRPIHTTKPSSTAPWTSHHPGHSAAALHSTYANASIAANTPGSQTLACHVAHLSPQTLVALCTSSLAAAP